MEKKLCPRTGSNQSILFLVVAKTVRYLDTTLLHIGHELISIFLYVYMYSRLNLEGFFCPKVVFIFVLFMYRILFTLFHISGEKRYNNFNQGKTNETFFFNERKRDEIWLSVVREKSYNAIVYRMSTSF